MEKMMAALEINDQEDFDRVVRGIERQEGYKRPQAFGVGVATLGMVCNEEGVLEEKMLEVFYPFPNLEDNYGSAAIFAGVTDYLNGTMSYGLSRSNLDEILRCFAYLEGDGKDHPNIDAVKEVLEIAKNDNKRAVVSFIAPKESDPGPRGVPDSYLRLQLLTHKLIKPNGINLDGMFGKLITIAWTSEGVISFDQLKERQKEARIAGQPLRVYSVDKFPPMCDYFVPSGIRIADASRVRLGAYLGEGTTIMHEGFCNFNAGCEGPNMIEGRISAGVFVGAGSDLGGSASIMGTLSGGGTEIISVGKNCLIGANAGIGFSLADGCIVEAGLYVTAGTKVKMLNKEGAYVKTLKAKELSKAPNLLFRRNSLSGAVECMPIKTHAELNEELHAHN